MASISLTQGMLSYYVECCSSLECALDNLYIHTDYCVKDHRRRKIVITNSSNETQNMLFKVD